MNGQIHFTVVSTPTDVRQILDLQAENLPVSLSAETMASQGFVTVKHDAAALQRMNDAAPAIIAKAGAARDAADAADDADAAGTSDRVIAYALVMPREFAPDVPILQPMFELLDGLSWNGTLLRDNPRWFVMGQICVAAGYRGRGVFDGLYSTMKEEYRSRYDFTVTEVAERNVRSLRAHERVGFQTLHTYPDMTTGEIWRVIVLDL